MTVLTLAAGILTIGLSIKSGLFPFHYWMPDTYGWATPTSASVLSSLVSKCYIFLLIKIYFRVIGLEVFEQMPIRNILLVLGMCGMVLGSVSAIRADSLNRMVAFSSAAQIGYIYMGIGLGGAAGYAAALFHMLVHSVTKSMLFLTTPRLAETAEDQSMKFRNLQGSGRKNPLAGFFFLAGAFSMIGIPVFAGFSSKLFFGMAAVSGGSAKKLILVMAALAVSSVLNALYFLRTAIRIGTPDEEETDEAVLPGNAFSRMNYTVPMLVLTAMNLSLGLVSWGYMDLIRSGLEMF